MAASLLVAVSEYFLLRLRVVRLALFSTPELALGPRLRFEPTREGMNSSASSSE
jgi:hypothetical protein